MQIVRNGNELIFFVKKEQATYWSGDKLETNYYLYTLDLTDKTVNENNFSLKDKDFYISEVIASVGPDVLLLKYYIKGTGYALLNYKTLELKGVSYTADYKYIFNTVATPVKGGLIFKMLLGTQEVSKEWAVLSMSASDGEIVQLPNESVDPNYSFIYVNNESSFKTDGNQLVLETGKDKSIRMTIQSLTEQSQDIIAGKEKIGFGPFVEFSSEKISWLSLNTSEVGLKKTMVTINMITKTMEVTFLDKKFDFPYKSIKYERNGNTCLIFYKLEGSDLIIDKSVSVN